MMVWKIIKKFCLTPWSAGVELHFREAPGWSGTVQMYVSYIYT